MNDIEFDRHRCKHELLHGQCAHCLHLDQTHIPQDDDQAGAPAELGARKARDRPCPGCQTEITRTDPVYFTADRLRVHRECQKEVA